MVPSTGGGPGSSPPSPCLEVVSLETITGGLLPWGFEKALGKSPCPQDGFLCICVYVCVMVGGWELGNVNTGGGGVGVGVGYALFLWLLA